MKQLSVEANLPSTYQKCLTYARSVKKPENDGLNQIVARLCYLNTNDASSVVTDDSFARLTLSKPLKNYILPSQYSTPSATLHNLGYDSINKYL